MQQQVVWLFQRFNEIPAQEPSAWKGPSLPTNQRSRGWSLQHPCKPGKQVDTIGLKSEQRVNQHHYKQGAKKRAAAVLQKNEGHGYVADVITDAGLSTSKHPRDRLATKGYSSEERCAASKYLYCQVATTDSLREESEVTRCI